MATASTEIISIRPAVASDAQAILDVHTSAIRESCALAYDLTLLQAWLAGKTSERYLEPIRRNPFFVASINDLVVGFGELDPSTAEICAVYVRPDHCRRGLGRALLETLEETARRHSLPEVHLHASLNSVSFYRAHGYVLDAMASVRLRNGTDLPCANMHKTLKAAL